METCVDSLRRAVTERYGECAARMMDEYNADYLLKHRLTDEECIMGDYPTMSRLDEMAKGRFSSAWMMAQLHDLSEYCGCRGKLEGNVLRHLASIISWEYRYLKVTEVLLFIHRMKSGRYGQFYGSIDPMVITTAMRSFMTERSAVIDRVESLLAEKMREKHASVAITREEYLRRKGERG